MSEQPTQLLSYAPVVQRERLLRKLVRLYGPWATYMALVVVVPVVIIVIVGILAAGIVILALLTGGTIPDQN